jgi:hypothetical protein
MNKKSVLFIVEDYHLGTQGSTSLAVGAYFSTSTVT